MSDSFDDILNRGIEAARAGDNDTARKLLARAIRMDPKNETAWLWMSGVVRTREERIKVLQQVLAINPNNKFAIKGLQALGVGAEGEEPSPTKQSAEPETEPEPEKPKPVETPKRSKPLGIGIPAAEEEDADEPEGQAAWDAIAAQQPEDAPATPEESSLAEAASKIEEREPPTTPEDALGFETNLTKIDVREEYDSSGESVPLPSQDAIDTAKASAYALIDELEPQPDKDIRWVRAEAEASGVSSADVKRLSSMRTRRMLPYIGGGVAALVLLGVVIFGIISITRTLRQERLAEELANQPTEPPATNTPRPTETITPIPTRTPLPESLALTLEPTVTPGQAPRGNIEFRLTATPPYILTPHGSSLLTSAYQPFYDGDYEEAIDLVRRARENGDNDIDGYYIEGVSLYRQGNVDEARDVILDGLDISPGFAPLNVAIGRIYLREGSLEQARAAFEQAISTDPNYLDPYLELARMDAQQNDLDAAFARIEEARASGRYNYDVNLLLTEVALNEQAGDLERALALAKLAYYIDPGSEEVNAKLAEIRLDLGYYDTAIVDLEGYLFDVFPSSATNWAWLGTAYEQVNRPDDAQVAFTRALQIDENNVRGYIGRGQYRLDERQYELALEDYNAAVELAPMNIEALVGRAAAYTQLEQYDEALADFNTIFELTTASGPVAIINDPDVEVDIDFLLLYSETLLRTGDYAQVTQFTTEALVRDITDEQRAEALELRAQAQLEQGNIAGARSDIEGALSFGETGQRHFIRGRVLEASGLIGQAVREYEWVLLWDQVYGFEFADEASDRLEALTDG